jgi:hypothetical protein
MLRFQFDDDQRDAIASLIKKTRQWAKENQCAVGISEIALGVALLKYGISHDLISVGTHLVGTAFNTSMKAGLVSGGIAGIAGAFLGNIGVAALGGAIGIPGVVLAGGAAAVFGCAGYGVSEMLKQFTPLLDQAKTVTLDFAGSSLVAIAVALIFDGAKRILGSHILQKIKSAVSSFINGVLNLIKLTCKVTLKNIKDFHSMVEQPEKKWKEAESSANVATFTFLTMLILFHAFSLPVLMLVAILFPVWSSFLAMIDFRMNATDDDQFLHGFGM